ncbi:hypothetical protein IE81DRAFT_349992 [Ceraceosorus guamensis]|uniref:Uncharacterized protein n=1 Tax=Ceraceosorus guamensis TaxID=1522189 RepID=A0A316VW26_9BASI|nr:hypothetical protein IE81DRAFT_349992 [Ceraceosorus guamensis]PWN39645.1 hypothetical protein IE81DRAFT_349992 [Ceraceosorus guamensis]
MTRLAAALLIFLLGLACAHPLPRQDSNSPPRDSALVARSVFSKLVDYFKPRTPFKSTIPQYSSTKRTRGDFDALNKSQRMDQVSQYPSFWRPAPGTKKTSSRYTKSYSAPTVFPLVRPPAGKF